MFKIYISCLFAVSAVSVAKGQISAFEIEQLKLRGVALENSNAALLNTVDLQNLGESFLYFKRTDGAFKHPMLAKESNYYGFSSERYQTLKNWKVYGRIRVDMGQEADVPHTTQLNPLRINPYIIVDSLSGDWNKQSYALETKLASPLFYNRLGVGMGLKYHVATGARQRDPRPQNTNNELELTPSIMYQINGANSLGINALYRYFVEDFSVSTINTSIIHNMYKLIGVGEYVGSSPTFISTSGITRRYEGNNFGGALQYIYRGEKLRFLGEAFANRNSESAKDGTTNPQEAGKHEYIAYGANVEAIYSAQSTAHRVDFGWSQKDIDNTEYHQYQDPETRKFVTLFSNVFNTNLMTNADFKYTFAKYSGNTLNWNVGAGISYSGWDNKYSSNQSQQTVDRLTYGVSLRKYFEFKNLSAFSIDVRPSYSQSIDSEFAYDEKSYSTNFVADHILYPTNAFLEADYFHIGASLQYNFKPAQNNTRLYLKLSENYSKPTKDAVYFNKSQYRLDWQIALGLLTF